MQAQLSTAADILIRCSTRWNSTYLMIEYILPSGHVFTTWIHSELHQDSIIDHDWIIFSIFHSFLKTFYNHTVNLSVVYTPISNLVLHSHLEFTEAFTDHRDLSLLQLVVRRMEQMFKNYWEKIPYLYSFGFILDPC